jgi:hypothetical protein
MKRGDTKKPYNGESIDLQSGRSSKLLVFTLIVFTSITEGQVPINGFCRYSSFDVEPGNRAIFTVNLPDDPYTDLILFSPDNNEIEVLTGDAAGEMKRGKKMKAADEITRILPIYEAKKPVVYAYTSRRKMKAGIYSLDKRGELKIDRSIKFNSYPENVAAADINRNGEQELLISGSAFSGLSILHKEGKGFKEVKLERGTTFTNAVFAELNNDGFPDIAAFDVTSNEILFFYNDGRGNFRKIRSIPQATKIVSFRSFDVNLDYYDDLLFVKGNSIHIYYGDYSSSYEKRKIISTEFYPDKIVVGDFNRDGEIDMAYSNYERGVISIMFGNEEGDFYPEIRYLEKKGIKHFTPYYSKFISGIAAVSEKGKVYMITNLRSISSEVSITFGGKPSTITYFDYDDNGIFDIAYIDKERGSLNLLLRNNEGVFDKFYPINIYDAYENIVVYKNDKGGTTFYCYSGNKRIIEGITIKSINEKPTRFSLNAPGEVLELKLGGGGGDNPDLLISYKLKGGVNFGKFEYFHTRYRFKIYDEIAGNVYGSSLFTGENSGYTFWKNEKDSLVFYRRILERLSTRGERLGAISNGEERVLFGFTGDLLNRGILKSTAFVRSGKGGKFIVVDEEGNSATVFKDVPEVLSEIGKNNLYFGEKRINGLKRLFVYIPEIRLLLEVSFSSGGKKVSVIPLFSGINAGGFFIKNLNTRNYHFVYTNKDEECITILPIQ